MPSTIDPCLTEPDILVLRNLFNDIDTTKPAAKPDTAETKPELRSGGAEADALAGDQETLSRLRALNDPKSPDFQPTVFVSFDEKDLPAWLNEAAIKPYARFAASITRHPRDVVFLTHIILYLSVNVPSAIYLFYNFTYIHGVLHTVYSFWCAGSFTLLMHNHIHNNGVLAKDWYWLDVSFPYILEPLMGHTWDSYYYHHVKHHHVEGNGPDDLSSTIRYQRDSAWSFAQYFGRFFFLIWLDLPIYFFRKGKANLAVRAFLSEAASYAFLYYMTFSVSARASVFALWIPFMLMRLGLMVGNWGQHAFVDEVDPDSDFRSSITLIDVPVSPPFLLPPSNLHNILT